nr:hypothetical protein [Tanacetum cinerariifolium]
MVIVNWKLRPKGDRVNPYVKYKNDLNLFTLKVNHGGVLTYVFGPKRTRAPRRVYKGGNADWFDDVDADGFFVLEVLGMVKELGYENPQMKFYYKKPTADLDKGLEPLSKDIDILDMLSYVNKYKLMEVFIEHPVENSIMDTIDLEQEDASVGLGDENVGNLANDLGDQNVENVSNDLRDENVEEFDPLFSNPYMQIDNNEGIDHNEGSGNNKRSDHNEGSNNNKGSDHNEGSDNNEGGGIDDVHVDMQMFKDNIDSNVEWVSSTEPESQAKNNENLVYEEVDLVDFDSEINSDEDEAERRKALRKLELKERNPDTTVKIDVERDYEPDSMTRQFRRIYVCLCALKSGFKAGQRDLLGLDGCFMSGPFPMQILTAVGVDPNYGIYPLAYAIVESENKQAWLWFLDCLGDDLEFRNSNFTFVTYRKKGLIPALAETFPAAEHRYCLKHIYDNMKLQWKGQQFKDLLWKCATATTVSYFNRNMKELKCANKELYDWLKLIPAQHWARSYFSGVKQTVEGWKGQARHYLFGVYKRISYEKIVIVQHVIRKSNGPLTPKATKEQFRTWQRMAWNQAYQNHGTCKGQRGATSAPTVNQTQITQTTVNPSAPAINLSQTTQTTVNSPSQTSPTMRYTKQKASRYSPAKNTNASGKRKAEE